MLSHHWMTCLDDDLGEILDWFSQCWWMMIELDNVIRGETPEDQLTHLFSELRDCSAKCRTFSSSLVMELLANGEHIDVGKQPHHYDAINALAAIVSRLDEEVRLTLYSKSHPEIVDYWDYNEVEKSVTVEELVSNWKLLSPIVRRHLEDVDDSIQNAFVRQVAKAQYMRKLFGRTGPPELQETSTGPEFAGPGRPRERHALVDFARRIRQKTPAVTRPKIAAEWTRLHPEDPIDAEILRKAESYYMTRLRRGEK